MTHMNVQTKNGYAASKLESLHELISRERLKVPAPMVEAERDNVCKCL